MWMDEGVLTHVSDPGASRRCRRRAYSDVAIQMLPGIKLRKLAYPGLPVPTYTTLSRRAKTLKFVLPVRYSDEPMQPFVVSPLATTLAGNYPYLRCVCLCTAREHVNRT
ncbi:hypothetical protein [Paraburkholderia mimosarum]|uniref:hypothetical protein n=1 Tax=Paraburkholderia mimosarum TaxID=312026 RepID=UPI00055F2491